MTSEKLYELYDMSNNIKRFKRYKQFLEQTYNPTVKIYSSLTSSSEINLSDVLTNDELNDILSLAYQEVIKKLQNMEKEFNEA